MYTKLDQSKGALTKPAKEPPTKPRDQVSISQEPTQEYTSPDPTQVSINPVHQGPPTKLEDQDQEPPTKLEAQEPPTKLEAQEPTKLEHHQEF